MIGIGRHLWSGVEAYFSGNSLKSMKVTLVRTPRMEYMEPESSIFCYQARLPVLGLRHQPRQKPLTYKSVLTSRCASVVIVANQ